MYEYSSPNRHVVSANHLRVLEAFENVERQLKHLDRLYPTWQTINSENLPEDLKAVYANSVDPVKLIQWLSNKITITAEGWEDYVNHWSDSDNPGDKTLALSNVPSVRDGNLREEAGYIFEALDALEHRGHQEDFDFLSSCIACYTKDMILGMRKDVDRLVSHYDKPHNAPLYHYKDMQKGLALLSTQLVANGVKEAEELPDMMQELNAHIEQLNTPPKPVFPEVYMDANVLKLVKETNWLFWQRRRFETGYDKDQVYMDNVLDCVYKKNDQNPTVLSPNNEIGVRKDPLSKKENAAICAVVGEWNSAREFFSRISMDIETKRLPEGGTVLLSDYLKPDDRNGKVIDMLIKLSDQLDDGVTLDEFVAKTALKYMQAIVEIGKKDLALFEQESASDKTINALEEYMFEDHLYHLMEVDESDNELEPYIYDEDDNPTRNEETRQVLRERLTTVLESGIAHLKDLGKKSQKVVEGLADCITTAKDLTKARNGNAVTAKGSGKGV